VEVLPERESFRNEGFFLDKTIVSRGGNYQTLMNDALKQFAQGLKLSDVVREAIHETWETCLTTHSTGRGKKLRTG
jgi:hypothetical protein